MRVCLFDPAARLADWTPPHAVTAYRRAQASGAVAGLLAERTGLPKEPLAWLGQLALLWLYAHPSIVSALPNIYNEEQIAEFAAASDHPPLSDAEMEQIHEMYEHNFDITPYVEEAVSA